MVARRPRTLNIASLFYMRLNMKIIRRTVRSSPNRRCGTPICFSPCAVMSIASATTWWRGSSRCGGRPPNTHSHRWTRCVWREWPVTGNSNGSNGSKAPSEIFRKQTPKSIMPISPTRPVHPISASILAISSLRAAHRISGIGLACRLAGPRQ